ncbi:hypothetical protein [Desulfopila aestuarii]|uniref:hypothetical protein n=1 Tax=Desulfopila aestuarii TaxID=231440 RepID=UPI00093573BD|nr:hypothetical protein [Desulfopila aestuarii]
MKNKISEFVCRYQPYQDGALARVGTFAALLKGDIGLTLESYVLLIVAALVARSILLILLISVRVP